MREGNFVTWTKTGLKINSWKNRWYDFWHLLYYNLLNTFQEEDGESNTKKVLQSVLGDDTVYFEAKIPAASIETTEKMLQKISPKLLSSITNFYQADIDLFGY